MIESTTEKREEEGIKYPCIMIDKDTETIILFRREGCGTVLHTLRSGPQYSVGNILHAEREEDYEIYKDHITLRNKL